MFHIEWRGIDVSRLVDQGTVSITRAIGERPVGSIQLRIPETAGFGTGERLLIDGSNKLWIDDTNKIWITGSPRTFPADFDEVTVDYPGRPYRAEAITDAIAYWPFDERAQSSADDILGTRDMVMQTGTGTEFRAYQRDQCAVTHGGAIEFTQTTAAGARAQMGTTNIGQTFSLAGFFRVASANKAVTLVRVVKGSSERLTITVTATGQLQISLHNLLITSAAASVTAGVWHHVALVHMATRYELWLNGVRVGSQTIASQPAPLDGDPMLQLVYTLPTASGRVAIDEWGLWNAQLDVPDLWARRRHRRHFGGYVYGVKDSTIRGPLDTHVLQLPLVGYGLRLDTQFVRRTFATKTGSSVREIVAAVLAEAGLNTAFNANGVELEDTVSRAIYPIRSVMAILRELAETHGAIVTVDEWRSLYLVRTGNVEYSGLTLRTAPSANVREINKVSEPRFFSSRVVVVGKGEQGLYEDTFMGDGTTTTFDLTHQPERIEFLRLNGTEQVFEGDMATWSVNLTTATLTRAAGQTVPGSSDEITIGYLATEDLVVTRDNQAAVDAVGFPVARLFEDDAIDTPALARSRAAAYLDRHDQPTEYYTVRTLPSVIDHVQEGTTVAMTFPRFGLNNDRLLVESVTTSLPKSGASYHGVVHEVRLPAQDYHGDFEEFWRALQQSRPPSPRLFVPIASDPTTIIVRPGDISVPAGLPFVLGGSSMDAVTSTSWAVAPAVNLLRVSGNRITLPLQLTFMGRCRPSGALGAGQQVEVRLWDSTTSSAIGSAVSVTSTDAAGGRGVLRDITLPPREFDLTVQARVVGGLRAAVVWSILVGLDSGA